MSESKDVAKLIASNPSASHDYILEEIVEAGIVLQGTEIKSIRNQTPNLKDSFVEITHIKRGEANSNSLEAWLVNLNIAPYSHGNIWNHLPKRRRKLLLHGRQIVRMFGALTKEGKTIVPTRMYYLRGRVKVEIAIARGKKKGDKRADSKKKTHDREMDQAMKQRRKNDH